MNFIKIMKNVTTGDTIEHDKSSDNISAFKSIDKRIFSKNMCIKAIRSLVVVMISSLKHTLLYDLSPTT